MKSHFQVGRNIWILAWIAVVPWAAAQVTFDLAADYSASQNPHGAWSFGWMAPSNSVFNPYTIPVAAYGLSLNEWRGPFPDDNGSAPPDVICNPTDTAITVSDTTWLPHQVTFHPGPGGERSVIRWTSPLEGSVRLVAAFEGRSGFVTSGVEIYQNSAQLFSGAVLGTGAASQITLATNLVLQIEDAIDFRVNYGNGIWDSDTTQIGVVITPLAGPSLTITCLASNSVQLAWSTNNPGYHLESAAQIPTLLWSPVTNLPVVQVDRFTVTVGTSNQSQFFRLRKP